MKKQRQYSSPPCARCRMPIKRGENFLHRPQILSQGGTTIIDYPKKVHYPVCPCDIE